MSVAFGVGITWQLTDQHNRRVTNDIFNATREKCAQFPQKSLLSNQGTAVQTVILLEQKKMKQFTCVCFVDLVKMDNC